MSTRKNITPNPYQHPRHKLAPRVVIPFAALGSRQSPAEVFYFDFLIFRSLRITNTTESKLSVMDLIVNREFEPGAMLTDWFYVFRYPVVLEEKAYFEAILQSPSATEIPLDCSYPKRPSFLTLSTNRGTFNFEAGEDIVYDDAWPEWKNL